MFKAAAAVSIGGVSLLSIAERASASKSKSVKQLGELLYDSGLITVQFPDGTQFIFHAVLAQAQPIRDALDGSYGVSFGYALKPVDGIVIRAES